MIINKEAMDTNQRLQTMERNSLSFCSVGPIRKREKFSKMGLNKSKFIRPCIQKRVSFAKVIKKRDKFDNYN